MEVSWQETKRDITSVFSMVAACVAEGFLMGSTSPFPTTVATWFARTA